MKKKNVNIKHKIIQNVINHHKKNYVLQSDSVVAIVLIFIIKSRYDAMGKKNFKQGNTH